ncbi:MAG: ImmA/IrrE family metallo-endopeptidase [Faecalicatena sp.]|uniref:ImmA/IrrE family metallo-endopeptidase n=1 Tax=Faecalicatena sp. TaxID=2005360 RepID=UPI00258C96F1|nr:ImmA/IrrE family metallo-endopeptidase [Faecalicatena sp.]MCI6468172.1 ImmA/IrrE family metallo-endopeptidase [Faecalicatena sp.]MDY5620427.1 ImmA/IrrE family metallo-endopeptidase [Lachnospiraceae bacterium]
MDIPNIVRTIVEKCETRNPFRIIEQLGVILIYYPLEGVNGFYQYFQRNNIIYIDDHLSEHEAFFVCAHELGHMLMHKKSNAMFLDSRSHLNTCKYEMEANRFAVNLLISDRDLREYLDYTTDQLSSLFGCSKKMIELRMKDFV